MYSGEYLTFIQYLSRINHKLWLQFDSSSKFYFSVRPFAVFRQTFCGIIVKLYYIIFSTWDSEDDAALKKAVKLYGSDWIASKSSWKYRRCGKFRPCCIMGTYD